MTGNDASRAPSDGAYLVSALVCIICFTATALLVVGESPVIAGFDDAVRTIVANLRGHDPYGTVFFDIVYWFTQLGDVAASVVVAVAFVIYTWVRHGRRLAMRYLALFVFDLVVIYVFKLAIGRERPVEALIVPPRDPSFPSGHTFNAVFMIGIIVYSIFGRMHDGVGKTALITVYALYVLAMGASRIYLGVHWPSDVLGALFLGFSCLSGAVYLFGERLLPGPSPEG